MLTQHNTHSGPKKNAFDLELWIGEATNGGPHPQLTKLRLNPESKLAQAYNDDGLVAV
jgi:hypothetical protein